MRVLTSQYQVRRSNFHVLTLFYLVILIFNLVLSYNGAETDRLTDGRNALHRDFMRGSPNLKDSLYQLRIAISLHHISVPQVLMHHAGVPMY